MASDSVLVERDDTTTVVTINRPHRRNAVDRTTADELSRAFREFDQDSRSSVAILSGAGGTFCSGADLKAFQAGQGNRVEPDGDGPMGPTRLKLSKPVIAAISGHAVAGGLELALWADLRVAEETAILGVFCRRWGVPLIDGGTVRLPRLIGESRAMDLILTGRAVSAREAYQMGLVNRIVPPGTCLAAARQLATELAKFPQTCLRRDRASLTEQYGMDLDGAMANEFRHGQVSMAADAEAGADRFVAGTGTGTDEDDEDSGSADLGK